MNNPIIDNSVKIKPDNSVGIAPISKIDALKDALSKPSYRLPDETFEAYKIRQKIKNKFDKFNKHRKFLLWDSSKQGTFKRE